MATRTVPTRAPRRSVLVGAFVAVVVVAVIGVIAARSQSPTVPASGIPAPIQVPTEPATLTPHTEGDVTTWTMPDALVGLRDVEVGADGRVWLTEQNTAQIASLDGDRLSTYQLNASFPDAGAFAFAPASDGSLWFTGYPGGTLGRVLPDGRANLFGSRGEAATTLGIVQGPDGAMWTTDPNLGEVVRIGEDGSVRPTLISEDGGQTRRPGFIAPGSDGALWFTIPDTDEIGRITTGDAPDVTRYRVPGGGVPRDIVAAPDGTLWASLEDRTALVRIDPAQAQVEVVPLRGRMPTPGLDDLALAPDGTIWVTTPSSTVLHVGTDGRVLGRVTIPGASYADGVTVAPDGAVWVAARDDVLAKIQP